MPSPTENNQPTVSSFLGLQSYTEAQSNLFFGRDTETDALTSLVELNTLTIVFGRSGTGKTSLLNAGVFPKLRKSFCLPFRIRLEFNDNSSDLVTQIKKVLKEEIDKYGFKVESYPSGETLWEYFHKEPLWKTVTPIIVFDQFEEIFTLAKANPRFASIELPLFWEELSNLIENNIPEKLKEKFLTQKEKIEFNYKKQKAKIVFSFREEYLPEFETIASKIPSLKYSRFRLLPMNGHQAYEVITKTWKENVNPSEARHIVSYFTNEPGLDDYSLLTVEPSLLSQVCAYIDKERIEGGGGKVSAELLNKYPKETILRSIYNEAVTAANNSLNIEQKPGSARNFIKEFVEDKLITSQGYRIKYNLGANDDILKPGITVLAAKYFVREDDNVVELTHDVVAPIIKTDREKRRTKAAQAKTRKKALRIAALIILIALLGGTILALIAITEKEKVEAQRKTEEGLLEIAKASKTKTNLELGALQAEINMKRKELENMSNNPVRPDNKKTVQDLLDELNYLSKAFAELKLKTEGDISALSLKLRNTPNVAVPGTVIHQQNKKIDSLQDLLNKARWRYDSLLEEYNKLKIDFDKMKQDRDDWKRKYDSLIKIPNQPKPIDYNKPGPRIINPSVNNFDTTNSLKLNLYYGKKYNSNLNPPSNLTIYLIPYENNSGIIKKAKVYEINCDEADLKKASNYKVAVYYNGYYYFSNVDAGKYFIKICTYYGGFYNYTKRSGSMETLNWDASPPIR
jgi:hypothetical protein